MEKDILGIEAEVFNALAHPMRLMILAKLRDGACCVCKIIPYVGGEQSNVSHHLAILRNANIVRSEKHGLEVWYEVINPLIFKLIDIVDDCIVENLSKSKDILRILAKERK